MEMAGRVLQAGWRTPVRVVRGAAETPAMRSSVRITMRSWSVESVVNDHFGAWRNGAPTPLKPTLDVMYARWLALRENEPLMLDWPMRPLAWRSR